MSRPRHVYTVQARLLCFQVDSSSSSTSKMAIVATASTSSLRESLDTPESNAKLNKANEIITRIENAGLNISSAQARFEQKISEFTDYDQQSFLTARKSPGDIAREVEAQIVRLQSSLLFTFCADRSLRRFSEN